MIKKGDKVKVTDNSYCYKIGEGGLTKGHPASCTAFPRFEYHEVVETDMKLPTDFGMFDKNKYNDTVIRGLKSGNIHFTQREFLKNVKGEQDYIKDLLNSLSNYINKKYSSNEISHTVFFNVNSMINYTNESLIIKESE